MLTLGVLVGLAVGDGQVVGVGVSVGVGVGVNPGGCAKYIPPVFKRPPCTSLSPPQTIIWLPVHTAT